MKRLPLLACMIATCALAAQETRDVRFHYIVTDRSHTPVYYVTTASALDDKETSDVTLVRNALTGERLKVEVHRDFKSHETTAIYTLNQNSAVTVRMKLPYISATTRQETVRENKEHRAELWARDVPVTVESKGRAVQTTEKTWKRGDASSKDHRSRVKAAIDPALAAAVLKLAPAFAFPDLSAACSSIPFVTDGSGCVGDTAYMLAPVPPDCGFDAEFGLPCNADHAARAKALRASRRQGPY
jgi:hypothetical protein